jgi:hypothetical protein
MRIRLLILVALVVVPAWASVTGVWQDKPVQEWTREETQEFFRHSPWVHQIIVTNTGAEVQPASYPASSRESQPDRPSTEGIKVEPRLGANGAVEETAYYIEWSSSKIVRRAGAHYRALRGQGREEERQPNLNNYVLTVSGYDLAAFDGPDAAALKEAAFLRPRHANKRIRPSKVEVLRENNDRVIAVRYTFPTEEDGQPLISDRETCVDFRCKAGDLRLRTKFKPSEMVIDSVRDL